MLLQITQNCNFHCTHCLHDCDMSEERYMTSNTLQRALEFADSIGSQTIIVTGGEPSLHPKFEEFCRTINHAGFKFIVTTNGWWITIPMQVLTMRRIARLTGCVGIQVTTDKRYYGDKYALIKSHQKDFERIPKCSPTFDVVDNLEDLGRAKKIFDDGYIPKTSPSCINPCLISKQVPYSSIGRSLEMRGKNCTPLVDWLGKVHASESCLCQSLGDVFHLQDLPESFRQSKPCFKCRNSKFFLENPNYEQARKLLGIE